LKIDAPPLFLPDRVDPRSPAPPRHILGAPGLLTGQDKAEAKKPLSLSTNKVMPRETLPMLGLPQANEYAKKLPEPGERTNAERELTDRIRAFLQSKSSLGSVQFAVNGERVYLKAAEQDTDALHEAARGIAMLPNVAGVILLDKTTPR
jgi:hypothetical protein